MQPPETPLGFILSKATTGNLEPGLVSPTSSRVLGGRRQR
jgi:hypothetical protein